LKPFSLYANGKAIIFLLWLLPEVLENMYSHLLSCVCYVFNKSAPSESLAEWCWASYTEQAVVRLSWLMMNREAKYCIVYGNVVSEQFFNIMDKPLKPRNESLLCHVIVLLLSGKTP